MNMCGRFAQPQTREEYLAYIAKQTERDLTYDLEPIGPTTWRQGQRFCS